jgi:hypothetical protein
MDMTRRTVISIGAWTAASAALPLKAFDLFAGTTTRGGSGSYTPSKDEFANTAHLTAADFKPWVGSVFDVHSGAARPALVILSAVEEPPILAKSETSTTATRAPAHVANQPFFALRFETLSGDRLKQGTYTFANNVLGRFALFVVPSGEGVDHPPRYTALVNRSTY